MTIADFIKDSSLSMNMGVGLLQSHLITEFQKLPVRTNLVQVIDALRKATESAKEEIEKMESENIKKYSQQEKAA